MPANGGLLQVYAPSLNYPSRQSLSEIADSLWRIFEIFPFSGDTGAETRFDLHCVAGVAAWLNLERLLLMDGGLRCPHAWGAVSLAGLTSHRPDDAGRHARSSDST